MRRVFFKTVEFNFPRMYFSAQSKPDFNALRYGLSVRKHKNSFTDWYNQLVSKGKFIHDYEISGFSILAPNCLFQWNAVKDFLNREFHILGVEEYYFPILVRQETFKKESTHLNGFHSELAWIDRFGAERLSSPLGIRPTSETIIYSFLSSYFKSCKQLPIKINQWCNVLRWEANSSLPLIRSKEFLWQEGHTVHATKPEALAECKTIIEIYRKMYRELFALPLIQGCKSPKETFAGAEVSYSLEALIPELGKAIQSCTSHFLGQNFSRIFDISYIDKNSNIQFPFQNSWGLSTRCIGTAVMMHSDNHGIIMSPRIAPVQVLIVACGDEASENSTVGKKCLELDGQLQQMGIRSKVDFASKERTFGFRVNQQEFQGIPLRVELGLRELSQYPALCVCTRSDGNKFWISSAEEIPVLFERIHSEMYANASKKLVESIQGPFMNINEMELSIQDGKFASFWYCSSKECEDELIKRVKVAGKIICVVSEEERFLNGGVGECLICNKESKQLALFGQSI